MTKARTSTCPCRKKTNKNTAGVFLDTLSAFAYKEIKKNGKFVLSGFGKHVKQKRKACTGNPGNAKTEFSSELEVFNRWHYLCRRVDRNEENLHSRLSKPITDRNSDSFSRIHWALNEDLKKAQRDYAEYKLTISLSGNPQRRGPLNPDQ